MCSLEDLDGDGITDVAVGSLSDSKGEVWILFLHRNGTVKTTQEIDRGVGGFVGRPGTEGMAPRFGSSVGVLRQPIGEQGSMPRLLVGADLDSTSGF